jgi:hypothetical protein
VLVIITLPKLAIQSKSIWNLPKDKNFEKFELRPKFLNKVPSFGFLVLNPKEVVEFEKFYNFYFDHIIN